MTPERALELLDAITAERHAAEQRMHDVPTPQSRSALDILLHAQTRARHHYVTIIEQLGDASWDEMLGGAEQLEPHDGTEDRAR